MSSVVPSGPTPLIPPRFSFRVRQNLRSLFSSALDATEQQIVHSTSTNTFQESDIAPLVIHLKLWCTLISLRIWISDIGKIHGNVFRTNVQPTTRCSGAKACDSRYKEDTFFREKRVGFLVVDITQSRRPYVTIRAFHCFSGRSAPGIGYFSRNIPLSHSRKYSTRSVDQLSCPMPPLI